MRGYVYLGGQMLAIQQNNQVSWVHQDPVTKSQRVTNSSGTVTSTIDLDPWGGETARSSNQTFQPHRYTTYERDGNGGDEAMMRRYAGKWHRFTQPDPYDGSYNLTNPQSFNRYAYVQNDPVNLVDPTGLTWELCGVEHGSGACIGQGFWGGGFNVNDRRSPTPAILQSPNGTNLGSGGNSGRETIGNQPAFTWSIYDEKTSTIYFFTRAPFTEQLISGRAYTTADMLWEILNQPKFSGRTPSAPQESSGRSDKEIQRRIDAGKAWDKWVAWNACAHPIWEKYQKQLDQYHGLWGEGFWLQVGVVIALSGAAAAENVPGMWGGFLLSVGAIKKMEAKYYELQKAYKDEATQKCGPEVSKPASHN